MRRLNFRGSGLSGDVEEIHVSLYVTLLHQFDRLRFSRDLVLQFEFVLFLEVASAGRSLIILVLVEPVLGVLIKHTRLGFHKELVLLLLLGLLLYLPHFTMGVINWSQFHTFKIILLIIFVKI